MTCACETTPAPVPRHASRQPVYCMLMLTRRCNLDCGYCHMAHEGWADPERDALARAGDLFMRSADNICFHLCGGEPLLRFDLVRWLLDHVAETYPTRQVQWLITSNGLLLKPPVVDWLVGRGVEIMLSLDGTYASQAEWRRVVGGDNRRAYDVVCDHVAALTARGVPHFLNMAVSPANVDRMDDNVRHIASLGVRRVQLAYELGALWDAPASDAFLAGLRRVIAAHHEEGRFEIMNAPDAEPVLGNMTFAVDTNGDLYRGCAMVLETHMPTFNDATRCGHVDALGSVVPLIRTRFEQVTDFLRYTRRDPHDWAILTSNYRLGYRVKRLLTRMGHRCWGSPP